MTAPALEHAFLFPLVRGLHARPAAALRRFAQGFHAECTLVNARNGRRANLQDLLSVIATDTGFGDSCRLRIQGRDAQSAREGLSAFLAHDFLETDREPEPAPAGTLGTALARLLEGGGTRWFSGVSLSPGLGEGSACFRGSRALPGELPAVSDDGPELEQRRFSEVLQAVEDELAVSALQAEHPTMRGILEAHRAILQDRNWRASVASGIRERALTARSAVLEAGRGWVEALEAANQPLLRERAVDVRDLCGRLVRALGEAAAEASGTSLDGPSIVVAWDLTLSQFLALDLRHVQGLVVADCGPTSHIAILARSFGIPLVGGIHLGPRDVQEGANLLLDGRRGLLAVAPPEPIRRYYAIEREAREAVRDRLRGTAGRSVCTLDGHSLSIQANLSLAEEAPGAFALGAEGVGLFRSETLFVEAGGLPGEDRQRVAYEAVLEAADGRPVTLRLLDVGGDKPLPGLRLPWEANPFLGRRAVRWYREHADVIRTQLRAALRTSARGPIRLMVPMVATREELVWVRDLMVEVARELAVHPLALGVMVEVPALALCLASVADLADFFCVGTNDLVQYLFAADRGNPGVARADYHWHPATLRMLDLIARETTRLGRPLSLCGEMAADPELLPLLAGLGYRTLSVAPSSIPRLKEAVERLDMERARVLTEEALTQPDADSVRRLLQAFRPAVPPRPLVEPDLVMLDAPCASREESLKLLVERLHVAGRTETPDAVEEAIWARECMVATGVGHGYAVPHCQTDALSHPTLALLRLEHPVRWGTEGEGSVHTVLLLALPGEEAKEDHLRLFAHLARRLMREGFRHTLEGIPDSVAVADFLVQETQGLI